MSLKRQTARAMQPAGTDLSGGFGLYIHWPYCTRICPYCDFNVARARGISHTDWTAAFLAELDYWAGQTGSRRINSIYFGGGTPSLMPPRMIETLITRCDKRWPGVSDAEITLELNPTREEAGHIEDFCAAGVNRISLGIQSFNPEQLLFLKRNNTVKDANFAIDAAWKYADRFSLDLIYGLPGQTRADLDRDLDQAFASHAQHLSFYQLTIEPGTAFERAVARNIFTPLNERTEAALYDHIALRTESAALPAYEISNHAQPGQESRHNQHYWHYFPYLGIGPGAHGRLFLGDHPDDVSDVCAVSAIKNLGDWLRSTPENRSDVIPLSRPEIAREMILMGLRVTEGLSCARYEALAAAPLDAAACATLVDQGLARQTPSHFILTSRGRKVLDSCATQLMP